MCTKKLVSSGPRIHKAFRLRTRLMDLADTVSVPNVVVAKVAIVAEHVALKMFLKPLFKPNFEFNKRRRTLDSINASISDC